MKKTRSYTYLGNVQGMCRRCRSIVPARVLADGGRVYQESLCPSCGTSRGQLADEMDWYLQRMRTTVRCKSSSGPATPVHKGCPHDCGPCRFHANACHLPVFSVTNVCNMNCPICFTYNRPDQPYHMTRDELRRLLDAVVQHAAPLDLVNVTGGEPTMHPRILDLLAECKRPQIGRVTMNSNGLRLATDEAFCRALADLDVYVVLSLDTLQAERSLQIHGQDVVAVKRKALENLQRFGVGTTLLNVMIRGVNDDEIGTIIELARQHTVVRSVTVQTMTYTGCGGKDFQPRRHMPLDGAARAIETATSGEMKVGHFFAHPGAHPLCYSVAYYLRGQGRYRSFTDFFAVEQLRDMIGDGYLLQPGDAFQGQFKEALDRVWTEGDDDLLRRFKAIVTSLYPTGRSLTKFQRQRIAEEQILTVYLHAHMDEDTLDLGRLVACCDQVPDPEGRMIPACAYNLFYRMRDKRFYASVKPHEGHRHA